jgi:hypothetical protein
MVGDGEATVRIDRKREPGHVDTYGEVWFCGHNWIVQKFRYHDDRPG